ncbi:F-box/kelch-repeat protein At3g23880-like [Papaver somniferum]|uniref:F-box/kelch-repeat protein At3g23880-like n=1 Tax=Papaver somniferum TaxID=3469 RepID=UPI000E705F08|nr:F-box/kelch-repeat protein At3g23880-like [Papaver somniferum]
MEYLSEDVIMEILLRLPVKSTVRFRYVCMSWYKLLTGNFVKVKLNHDTENEKHSFILNTIQCGGGSHVYSTDNSSLSSKSLQSPLKINSPFCDEIYVLGTYNGLVCASFGFGLYIWNPCTKQYKVILTVQYEYDFSWDLDRTGYVFCYDSKVQDYKVIVFFDDYNRSDSNVRVYTLGLNEWKTLPPIPYHILKIKKI